MAVKKITRKVITKKVIAKEVVIEKEVEKHAQTEEAKEGRTKKVCFFCQSKTNPSYIDTNVLRKFTNDRAKIAPRGKSGVCSKHQRAVAREIKYARHLSLLPFTPKV